MTDYVQTAEERIDDLCRDILVAGHLAKARRLSPDYADRLATRVRTAAADMIAPGDIELLRTTASTLERASTRIKSAGRRPRIKSAQPEIAAMIRRADAEQINRGGPFDRTEFESTERERIAEANRQLAEKNRRAEELRRRQVSR